LNLKNEHNSVNGWIESLLSRGKMAFSTSQLQEAFSDLSDIAIKRSLDRLSKKQKVVSIYRGYYLIIPPQYSAKGILPPALYIDGFMQFLQRPYYVGLLSAAAYHGAAHQQPQEFFVVTIPPALRPTQRKGIKVNYISKNSIPERLIENRNVETGYLKISSPALTAIDLVQFEKKSGGLNRVATVLNELVEVIKPEMFTPVLLKEATTYSIQRLGYLVEHALNQKELAAALYEESMKAGLSFYRVPLKAASPDKGFPTDENWKIIVNTEIETDF
jgi:predicted transcriptional regulator of viral defense system